MATIAIVPASAYLAGHGGLPLTQVLGRLTDSAKTTVAGPYAADAEGTPGNYTWAAVSIPDTWGGGYWAVNPQDGSGEWFVAVTPGDFGLPRTGEGEQLVTVTVEDGSGNPVDGALVTWRLSGVVQRWGQTNGSGVVTRGVRPGTYSLLASAGAGFNTGTASLTVVANTDPSVTVTLTAQASSPPAAPGLCAVLVRARDGSAALVAGCTVSAHIATTPTVVSDAMLTQQVMSGTTDGSGAATLQLIQGQTYSFTIKDPNGKALVIGHTVTVPVADSANFWELV